jgi:3-oxoadipate enol-lactonase
MIGPMVIEQRTTVKDRETRYLEAGSGRPVVLLHAFPFSADMWRPQLARVPDGWRFIAPDLRGFGGSPMPGGQPPTLDDYAEDVLGLLDVLDIDRAVISGLSMGGYITFALFRKASARFSGMILADTRPQPDTPEGLKGRRALLELTRTSGIRAVADDLIPKLVGETSRRERPVVVDDVRRLIEANNVDGIAGAIHALMTRQDSSPDLARISCPTLVIVGREDLITPVQESERMHEAIAGSRIVILHRAGHLSNLETPQEFSEALGAFLGSGF